MLMPNVLGTKEADFVNAEKLAGLGYAVFVADVYGQGNRATREDEDPARFMNQMNADRALLKERLLASLEAAKSLPEVDESRVAVTGYCFGGKCVLDLVRCGADILGAVSFHGVYDAPPFPNVETMTAKVLVCHGWNDPIAPPEAVVSLATELTDGGADWQIHAYGHTGHAFTDHGVNMPERGLAYSETAEWRSWKAMQDFLGEVFA
jgi:dienelactone hydrolase